jgi:hypothetical protein
MQSAFEAATRDRALTAERREDEAADCGVAARVLHADLVVASQTDPQWPGPERLDVVDRLAIESDRPVLIVPNAGVHSPIGGKVLVAWNAQCEAARAVFDALPLLQRARDVKVVWVNPQSERERAHDIPAADICVALARHDVTCQATEHVAQTLLACAKDLEADGLREFVFGGASRHVLAHMSLPVLMTH